MTPERWRQIEQVFQAALEREPAGRAAFLDDACRDDRDLRAEVDALLRANSASGSFLDRPAGLSTSLTGDPEDSIPIFVPGQLVSGRFRIVREIASGGMGVVYLATDEKLNEPRALKCAKAGHAGRLPPEARSALRVTHPNVCRVFEMHSTETPAGPIDVLTMEFIDGGTLSSAIETRGALPLAEAADVAAQICGGVAAAHAEGLLHRDLKSNNVLLTRDGHGHVRAVVTDFGLAQPAALSDGSGPAVSAVAGTPAYLAPERWRGEPATVASDIYALGVVLHEIVAGQLPRTEPGPTRAGLKSPVPGLPPRWQRVISRCLAADPAERFPSVTQVAKALAAPRVSGRFVAVIAAALALSAYLSWRVAFPAPLPTRLAVLALEAPQADAQTATLIRGASADISSRLMRLRPRPAEVVVIPIEETRGLTARDADQARARLGATHMLTGTARREGDEVAVEAAVIDTATKLPLRTTTARYRIAEPSAVAAGMAAMVGGAFHLPRQTPAETIAAAAYPDYAEGLSLVLNGGASYPQAIAAFERAAALDPKSVLPLTALAKACYDASATTADATWLDRGRKALAQAVALNADSIAVHLAAGRLSLVPGAYPTAVQEYRRAIDLDPESVEAWGGLARAYDQSGDHDNDAAAAYQRAIALQPGYYAPHSDLGVFYRRLGRYGEAESEWRQVVTLAPAYFFGYTNLGSLYSEQGRYDEAERAFKQALAIDARSPIALNNLGALSQYRGQDDLAVTYFEQVRQGGMGSYILELNLGDSYRRLGRSEPAAAAYRRGRPLAELALQEEPTNAARRAFVAYFALRLGDRATAERELVQALNMGSNDKTLIRRAVICYEAMGLRDKALAVLKRPAATADVLKELNRQPDLTQLQQDPRFIARLRDAGAR